MMHGPWHDVGMKASPKLPRSARHPRSGRGKRKHQPARDVLIAIALPALAVALLALARGAPRGLVAGAAALAFVAACLGVSREARSLR